MNEKKKVGEIAVNYVDDGMVVGLGTGSTVYFSICKIGELVKQGLSITGIPTSKQTENLAKELGIPLVSFAEIDQIDVAIDGADEVNSELVLIKGGGGALLREKIIAKAAETFIVVADSHKMVEKLGLVPLPVEVVPFGFEMTRKYIEELGCSPKLRQNNGTPFLTENGNYIFDCSFPEITNPGSLETKLNMIPGVVDNGLFNEMADIVITLNSNKEIEINKREVEKS
ncbi:ribose-5-phosphate isomerase RpiA [Neobacillus sp. PS3-12]|uniref:ribose-5-phosphate isomerase RpiA n=1 Tax=Neobacillus sp. PS3-12 TaxID=3070677 RepID=UPI0027DEB6A1|nr:ribose-5-phosphate isomerase RpiA [Neobacillus sp. PS3-12]WML52326.1 ribose-5-phosphate isomerase RpiA [Neobacillus sp. PS3-12]